MLPAELLALGTSVCTAAAGVMMARLSGRVSPVATTRWSMTFATGFALAAAIPLGGLDTLDSSSTGLLALSGLLSIIVAGPCFYGSIYTLGPRIAILLFSLNAPLSAVLAALLLGDLLAWRELAGIAVIISGLVLAVLFGRSGTEAPSLAGESVSARGLLLGLVAAAGQATGNLAAQPAMTAGTEPFAAMAVRAGVAAAAFIGFALVEALAEPRRVRAVALGDLGTIALSTSIGMGIGMPMLMAALAHGHVGVVSTLASMTPIAVLPLVWLQTGLQPVWQAWAGAALAVAGTALLFL